MAVVHESVCAAAAVAVVVDADALRMSEVGLAVVAVAVGTLGVAAHPVGLWGRMEGAEGSCDAADVAAFDGFVLASSVAEVVEVEAMGKAAHSMMTYWVLIQVVGRD